MKTKPIRGKSLLTKNEKEKKPADNKRFGEIGGEVITRISVRPLTLCDSPNCVQLTPQLRQAAGTLDEMQRTQRKF